MPKSLVLGNGNILICLDRFAQVRDFYFPYVGHENQTSGWFDHKIGVWVEGKFHWFSDGTWNITVLSEKETMAGLVTATNEDLELRIEMRVVVYNEKNIFLREMTVKNLSNRKRTVKVFFHQAFMLYESHRGDTAYYDPVRNVIVHYKGRRVFIINARTVEGRGFDDFCVGLFHIEGKEGTYRDAEDGVLSKNGIEHGMVDSVGAIHLSMDKKDSQTIYYWITVDREYRFANAMNTLVLERSPQYLMKTSQDYWHAWVNRQQFNFYDLEEPLVDLFKKSLLIMRTHVDDNGSILASGDSDMLQYGRDTYSYMWPRDAALITITLAKAGDLNVAHRFFEFCEKTVMDEGYFLHKYRPDTSLGSSWHPWMRDGLPTLPIQEDETALVVFALWEYYKLSKNLEFIEKVYEMLIKRTGYFMVEYVDRDTGLPKPSYDLWEEKWGVHTFSAASTYGGLLAAANFARLLGKHRSEQQFTDTAHQIRTAILKHLYDEKTGLFYKHVLPTNNKLAPDKVVDASTMYGLFRFDILETDDPRMIAQVRAVEERLMCHPGVGGIARYEGDQYYSVGIPVAGNPWFICTLWLSQYYIKAAKTFEELEKAKEWMRWTEQYAAPSGVLSEQLHPHTGRPLSVAPLTWSHSEYVMTVIQYLEKLETLGISHMCNPVK